MKVVIIGCGKVGTTILKNLIEEKHQIVAIDSDNEVATKISNTYDVIVVCGNGASYNVLIQAEVEKADIVIACTNQDELNILACISAKRLGAKHTVARIRNAEYNNEGLDFITTEFDLSLPINPELNAAKVLSNILKLPTATRVETFSSSDSEIYEVVLKDKSTFINHSLQELKAKHSLDFLVGVVERDEKAFIPNGLTVLEPNDKIGIISQIDDAVKILKAMGMQKKQCKSVIIVGASKIAFYLANILVENNVNVKIIDKKPQKCELISDLLPSSVSVVIGEGMNHETLQEEGITSCDAFISLTNHDEQNILMSLFAKQMKVNTVITKINQEELIEVAQSLGLDCTISPRLLVADVVLRFVRSISNRSGSQIERLYSLMDKKAEAIEFTVPTDWKYIGRPIKDLKIKKGILIVGIIRDNETIIPSGNDVILANDKVIIITTNKRLHGLTEII